MIACEWLLGCHKTPGEAPKEWFPASVPGCAQKDYARAHHWPDLFWVDNVQMYDGLEDLYWRYRTVPGFLKSARANGCISLRRA